MISAVYPMIYETDGGNYAANNDNNNNNERDKNEIGKDNLQKRTN